MNGKRSPSEAVTHSDRKFYIRSCFPKAAKIIRHMTLVDRWGRTSQLCLLNFGSGWKRAFNAKVKSLAFRLLVLGTKLSASETERGLAPSSSSSIFLTCSPPVYRRTKCDVRIGPKTPSVIAKLTPVWTIKLQTGRAPSKRIKVIIFLMIIFLRACDGLQASAFSRMNFSAFRNPSTVKAEARL